MQIHPRLKWSVRIHFWRHPTWSLLVILFVTIAWSKGCHGYWRYHTFSGFHRFFSWHFIVSCSLHWYRIGTMIWNATFQPTVMQNLYTVRSDPSNIMAWRAFLSNVRERVLTWISSSLLLKCDTSTFSPSETRVREMPSRPVALMYASCGRISSIVARNIFTRLKEGCIGPRNRFLASFAQWMKLATAPSGQWWRSANTVMR